MSSGDQPLIAAAIARRASRGALAYILRVGVTQFLQVASALAVAGALAPDEYGIIALALTLVGALRYMGDLGITYYLSVSQKIDESLLRTGAAVGLMVAVASTALLATIWPWLPLVAHGPSGSALIAPLLALTLIISIPRLPATILLERRLAFGKLGTVTIVETIVLFSTQVAMLLLGFGLWALVVAQLVGAVIGTIGIVAACGRRIWPSFRGPIRALVRCGLPFQTTLIATGLAGAVTPVIVASVLGARGVGLYAWATILTTPVLGVVVALHSVATPTLARLLRDDAERFQDACGVVLAAIGALAAAGAGCLVGLAPAIIRLIFGARWVPATGAVQVALLGVVPTSLVFAVASITDSKNQPRKRLAATIAGALASIVLALPLSILWGVTGAALGAYLVGPIVSVVALARSARLNLLSFMPRPALVLGAVSFVSIVAGTAINTPVDLIVAGVLTTAIAFGVLLLVEPTVLRRVGRQLRREHQVPSLATDALPPAPRSSNGTGM